MRPRLVPDTYLDAAARAAEEADRREFRFHPGQRVQVVGHPSRHYFRRGRIVSVHPVSGTCLVLLDGMAAVLAFGEGELVDLIGPG